MRNAIIRGFANVARFGGRDTRAQFWPYAAAAVALYLIVGWAALTPIMFPVFSAPQPSTSQFQNIASLFLMVSLLLFVALVVLLAAAVTRRLHDSGRSAIWGLVPLPFAAYSATMFFRLISQFESGAPPDTGLFISVFASNVLYMVGVARLIVLLAFRSTPAPNRYG